MNGYKAQIKREVIDALRDAIKQDFADWDLVKNVNVSMEYPTEAVHYPRIMVSLNERQLQLAGVGHLEYGEDEHGNPNMQRHYRFMAEIRFEIFALSSLERDELSAVLVNTLVFPNGTDAATKFQQEIFDADFIDMQIMNDKVTPTGDGVEDVPWDDKTRKVYTASYSVEVMGEFYTTHTGTDLITLKDVKLYPYKPGQAEPTGSTDPRDVNIPWS